ncbi:MAG: cobalt ECF transporter T component CbiQ [Armatimonadetes bacterium]|nr:cobalt ECF transporter T component CbiQ [Armatimonadota bacterium]
MNGSLLLPYRAGTTWLHRLDPRSKTAVFMLIALLVVLTDVRRWPVMAVTLAFLALTAAAARIPPGVFLARLSLALPFVLMVAVSLPWMAEGPSGRVPVGPWLVSRRGLYVLAGVSVKSSLAVLSLSLLSMITRFPDILAGLHRMRVPHAMLLLLAFMYRYLFVLAEEAHRMMQARESRSAGVLPWSRNLRVVGAMAASLFLRTYERAERILQAMLSRGFDGEFRTLSVLRLSPLDSLFIGLAITFMSLGLALGTTMAIGPIP